MSAVDQQWAAQLAKLIAAGQAKGQTVISAYACPGGISADFINAQLEAQRLLLANKLQPTPQLREPGANDGGGE